MFAKLNEPKIVALARGHQVALSIGFVAVVEFAITTFDLTVDFAIAFSSKDSEDFAR